MKAISALLKDRRRAQRGSVLSGVLMMMALVAIVAGALMTELSTNFILSSDLMNKAMNEATVDSAMELAMNQFETVPINQGCPDLTPAYASLNGRSAAPSYVSCWPAYRERTYQSMVSSAAFRVDGTHAVLPTASPAQDLYVVGDAAGNLYWFPFGQTTPSYVYSIAGGVTGPPVMVRDLASYQSPNDLMTLVPLGITSNPPSSCPSGWCVEMLAQDTGGPPDVTCLMAASDRVTTAAAVGINNPTVAFFADAQGSVFAYSAHERGNCALLAKINGSGDGPVAAPVVFPGSGSSDVFFVVTSGSIYSYRYSAGHIDQTGNFPLPQSGAVGVALEKGSVPARLAISFSDGHVAIVRVQTNFSMSLLANVTLPSGIVSGPTWCHCPNSNDQIGVAGANGSFYLLDTNLNVLGSFPAGTWAATAMPGTDSVGDWFVAGSDGYVHELHLVSAGTFADVTQLGPLGGTISSLPMVGQCGTEICIYAALQNGNAYRVPLDARDATITACISTAFPSCSGANPRLWARMEIGSDGNPNTVHVQGWSYYSG